jgi:quinol monooxygenase YgiN
MIIVAGSVRIRPDTQAKALELAQWMQRQTQAETGCLEYRFAQDLEHANLIHVFERWTDLNALEMHFGSTHMAQFNQQLGVLLMERPKVVRYTVQDATEMY